MRLSSLFASALVLTMAAACGSASTDARQGPSPTPNPAPVGPDPNDPNREEGPPKITVASKVDILVVVDNSASMADKSNKLAASLPKLLQNLASTNDIHLGVITSSLGTLGGDVCPDQGDTNMRAHLLTRGPDKQPLASARQGFLSFGAGTSLDAFVADAQSLVRGADQVGCGLEAQLEAAYRFLVQPDPYERVSLDGSNRASLEGIDVDLLQQRAAFLRPDSLLLVLMITDEDDSIADPRAIGGQGWAFMANQFPGSTVYRGDGKTTTAPRASSACATDPGSDDCTSCAFVFTCNPSEAACQRLKADPECQKNGGYWGPAEDQLNIRFHRMKERYGVDPQFPISRYVDGFTRSRVPDRGREHVTGADGVIGPYGAASPVCTNPLFAAKLPTAPGDELCALDFGTRSRELVVFGLIGGAPPALVAGEPSWPELLGADGLHYNYSGIDPHMIQSSKPRPGLEGPSSVRGDNGTDPIHGREYDTHDDDLELACTFALATPRTCVAQDASCDCSRGNVVPPLCGADSGQQIKGKAYPTVRELEVAKGLGDRAVVGSVCEGPSYDAFITRVADRIVAKLSR